MINRPRLGSWEVCWWRELVLFLHVALIEVRISFGWSFVLLRLLILILSWGSIQDIMDSLVFFIKISLHLYLLRHRWPRCPAWWSNTHVCLVISLTLHLNFWSVTFIFSSWRWGDHSCRTWTKSDWLDRRYWIRKTSVLKILLESLVLNESLLRAELFVTFLSDWLIFFWHNSRFQHIEFLL